MEQKQILYLGIIGIIIMYLIAILASWTVMENVNIIRIDQAQTVYNQNQILSDLNNINALIYSGTECAVRNNGSIVWVPSMIPQTDSNNNLIGVPVCIPFDRNSGDRIKNK